MKRPLNENQHAYFLHFLDVLAAAWMHAQESEPSDREIDRVAPLNATLARGFVEKYMSDSPIPAEKSKGYIAMLEYALKIAKGEIKL
jgi:hypothetical protein